MVLWAFSHPGDLNFDAFASSSTVLGSNRKAVVKGLDSFLALTSASGRSKGATVVPPSGRPSAVTGWVVGKVSDSLYFQNSALLKIIIITAQTRLKLFFYPRLVINNLKIR